MNYHGAYRHDNGKPVVLECVREAERRIAESINMEYLPMGGSNKTVDETLKLAYGENSDLIEDKRIVAVRPLSGTGACRLFADFQKRFSHDSLIYIPVPTCSNHHNIWRDANVPQGTFHYYHPETKGLDFASLMEDVKNAPKGLFFFLHVCAHNLFLQVEAHLKMSTSEVETLAINMYLFLGIGFGVLLSGARIISDGMLQAASERLAECMTEDEVVKGIIYPQISRF